MRILEATASARDAAEAIVKGADEAGGSVLVVTREAPSAGGTEAGGKGSHVSRRAWTLRGVGLA